MRIRTVKPEFWTDSLMVSMSRDTRLVFVALWNAADDHGWLPDDAEQLKMLLFPGDHAFDFETHLELLIVAGRVERHQSDDGKWVLAIAHWKDHQKVDHPAKSKIVRESSRKLAIPFATRKGVAEKYGCGPGEEVTAKCYFCDAQGTIKWWKLQSGKPSVWVTFTGLELDHFHPEYHGGTGVTENIVLSCRRCNRSRCDGNAIEFLSKPRDASRVIAPDQGSGIRERNGSGKGEESGADEPPVTPPQPPEPPPQTRSLPHVLGIETLRQDTAFCEAWRDWRAHLAEKERGMTGSQERSVLTACVRQGPWRCVEVVRFSIEKGAVNLIWDDAPRIKPPAGAKPTNEPDPAGWAEWFAAQGYSQGDYMPYAKAAESVQSDFRIYRNAKRP